METIEKFISALKEIENPVITNEYDLKAWQGKAVNIVVRVYGPNSKQEEQILNVYFKRYASGSINGVSFGGGNNSEFAKKQASEIIKGLINDLQTFGLPEVTKPENANGISISLSQHQNQTVQIQFIWELIKDELTGKQIKELETIINEPDSQNKKSKVIEKLKSFGGDVLTNIVANILTNPGIYGI